MARTLTKQEILSNPINYIYIFTNDSFIALVAKYISKSAASKIRQKAANQRVLVRNAYGSTADFEKYAYDDITAAAQEIYGYTPQMILKKLLAGKSVAGKNWKEGVFGIGSKNATTFSTNSDIKVDTATGQITDLSGNVVGTQAPLYETDKKGNTYISGYYVATDKDHAYTTKLGRNGKYYAYSQGDSNGMLNASGGEMGAKDFSSVWENIETYSVAFQQFIEWLFSILKNFGVMDGGTTAITRNNTQPSQNEFMTDSTSTASIGVIGALLIGGALIMGMPKTKNKKK